MIQAEALRNFSGKRCLVTGGTGLIGIPLVRRLIQAGACVTVASLDPCSPFGREVDVQHGDLCEPDFCRRLMQGAELVFHLAGIKGGIGVAESKAATFLVKNVLMNLQVMEAARRAGVARFLYVSSICIYPPAEVFREESAGTGLPHPSDRFGGMAKLVGEMHLEACGLEYGWDRFLIARPTNTYGPCDNFNPVSALIIPSLIHRVFQGENPLRVWGDGSAVRDFLYADDAADFLLLMMARNARGPYNVGTGEGVTIKTVVEVICGCARELLGRPVTAAWDTSRPTGEKHRVAAIDKARRELDWHPATDLSTGIRRTMEWYRDNRGALPERYSILSEESAL